MTKLENIIYEYQKLGIDQQIDYDKFYLYSLVTLNSDFRSITKKSSRGRA